MPLLEDIIINFFISLAASAAFYFLIENHKRTKNIKDEKQNISYDKKYIKNIKKQFYICFPLASFIVLWELFSKSNSFLSTFKAVIIFFLLLFSLFSFMCSIDVIDSFSKQISDKNSKESCNK